MAAVLLQFLHGVANRFMRAVEKAGLTKDDLIGKTLSIRISNPRGVCRQSCMAGLGKDSQARAGVIKQLSREYPGLTIRIAADGGNAYGKWPIVEVLNEQIINK